MSIRELTQSYRKVTGKSLINNSQLTPFNLLQDNRNIKFLNIFRSSKLFDLDVEYFLTHELDDNDWWDNLSNEYYSTPYLWWTIPLINKIENPFEVPESGTNIKILKSEYIFSLINEMKEMST